MATKVNLRKNNPTVLSVLQGDESLEHLSNAESVTTSRQLYTGGEYVVNGSVTLMLPTDGTKFAMTVKTGTVTFSGATVEGVTGATEQGPGRKVYGKVGSDWKILGSSSSTSDYRTITSSDALTIGDSWIWVDTSAGDVLLSIPIGLPEGKTFFIRRDGENLVTVDPAGSEGVVDPSTELTNTDGVDINEDQGMISLKKTGGHWRLGIIYDPVS